MNATTRTDNFQVPSLTDHIQYNNLHNTYYLAKRYVSYGLSVIPIKADGSKEPKLEEWKEYQTRKPTDAELRDWYVNALGFAGIAVLCGSISGNLEDLDLDAIEYR